MLRFVNVVNKCKMILLTNHKLFVIIYIERQITKGDNTMKNAEIRIAVAELQDLYAAQDVLKAQISEREQAIKEEMENRETEELNLGNVIIRFTSVLSNRFDTTAFKRLHKDLYNEFIKQVVSRRFSIA